MSGDDAETRLRATTERLKSVAVGSARLEARMLIEAAGSDVALREDFIKRRLAGEPVDRILGRRGFWSLDLIITPDTLSPRPDSETIIEAALDHLGKRPRTETPLHILDLGTGTGALLLALLVERPDATGIGIDISPAAVAVARRNAEQGGLLDRATFQTGSWTAGLDGLFDVVVSNPPYIPSADIAGLEREVRDHDPVLALDGGEDGLACYRQIFPEIARVLVPGGCAILEFGQGQGTAVKDLAEASGLSFDQFRNDLSGISRAIVLSKNG